MSHKVCITVLIPESIGEVLVSFYHFHSLYVTLFPNYNSKVTPLDYSLHIFIMLLNILSLCIEDHSLAHISWPLYHLVLYYFYQCPTIFKSVSTPDIVLCCGLQHFIQSMFLFFCDVVLCCSLQHFIQNMFLFVCGAYWFSVCIPYPLSSYHSLRLHDCMAVSFRNHICVFFSIVTFISLVSIPLIIPVCCRFCFM